MIFARSYARCVVFCVVVVLLIVQRNKHHIQTQNKIIFEYFMSMSGYLHICPMIIEAHSFSIKKFPLWLLVRCLLAYNARILFK